ncbi:CaiB/BaiF CoA-transferase family protein [Reyranella sp.]|jgi:alpha-methylacyl-CoA racemase|uniref:CaiB/BaiF CoA transferase family protein n=1 Tax=Reyranella sp. TaxID=1929291 RepID=UPI000BC39A8B|nr:CaiB/BaiF CoA-transferase family protein [Reyranella sp.]OYY45175.1 MAG: carnitine dehydratase [Rhodospirillales bacterium 35-66-84]OYZ95641.1 MAG: carnitine dehydratase [Rhodospirillales bacterium 24-66-33]OZB27159.1 MAG: carnitine dehydratase [Rhodospirillales bacterium 39-66-50]HQS16844.1 CaiB/BaiF CoA-transferase family protein [Reyranella sp.]HQT12671.1 CaiB/BaiF CoA-transferase family protein [Reyranella sp.]
MAGPLTGLTIVELAGIGPGPMCSMMLGDMGADVIRVDRTKAHVMDRLADPKFAVHNRSRRSVSVDLQSKAGVEVVLRLIEKADGMTEPFRPGVAERLGLGPDVCLARNPKLVYGRMTGWGQDGPLAKVAGHDINYIALTGALHAIGGKDKPVPPLNLVGDFGGGGMLLAFGMVCGLLESQRSGKGQVVDAAMVDGTALLLGALYGMTGAGLWNAEEREGNLLDGGAHFYGTYETKDGKHVSIGSIEPQFYALLLEKTGLKDEPLPAQMDRKAWGQLKDRLGTIFKTRTRDEWCAIMEGTDICFAPVLTMKEAPHHPHAKARNAYVDVAGFPQPAAAPRFSRTKEGVKGPAARRGQHTDEILGERGFSAKEIEELKATGVVGPQA